MKSRIGLTQNNGALPMEAAMSAHAVTPGRVPSKKVVHKRMAGMIIVTVSLLLLFVSLPSAIALPSIPGERVRFHYRVHKLGATVLTATLSIEQDGPFRLIKAAVDTTGVTRLFFRMHNRFSSYIKEEGFVPSRYIKEVDQWGIISKKKRYTDILTFDPAQGKVLMQHADSPNTQEITIPSQTYDPLAIFFKCFCEAETTNGRKLDMRIYDGIKLREVTFAATPAEITTPLYGAVKAILLESKVPFNSFGDKEGVIKIWYTNDAQRLPVQISLELPVVGDMAFELERVEKW